MMSTKQYNSTHKTHSYMLVCANTRSQLSIIIMVVVVAIFGTDNEVAKFKYTRAQCTPRHDHNNIAYLYTRAVQKRMGKIIETFVHMPANFLLATISMSQKFSENGSWEVVNNLICMIFDHF